MVKNEHYLSMSDQHQIYLVEWSSHSEPIGIIQLSHGMAEHILRYEEFAQYAAEEGYIVIGHDHRGHGQTADKNGIVGFFAEKDGFERAVLDLQEINQWIKERYPGKPIILLGHSMGSFLVRRYIQHYSSSIQGAILSGTGGNPGILGNAGLFLAKREMKKKGNKTESPFLDKLSFGNFNRAFKPSKTAFDWLSRDQKEVQKYIDDPYCGRVSTTGFFYDLLYGLKVIHRHEEVERVRKDIPLFLYSGSKDPVGKNAKGVYSVAHQLKSAGIEEVKVKIYPDGRHEMFNETNRLEVFQDVMNWINSVI